MRQTVPNVAIVDDDPAVLRALARVLKTRSIAAATFSSGRLFLASLEGSMPDCLIVDYRMPEMTGLDLLQMIVNRDIQIPTIVITAHDSVRVREQCMAAGAVAFLAKPISETALVEAIELARTAPSR